MGRNANQQQASLSTRLKNKSVLGLTGAFTVPAGVTTLYYTGVAAGARDGSTALVPYTGWSGTTLALAVSPNENHCFATCNNASAVSSAPRLDPVGRKVSLIGTTAGAIPINAGGVEAATADNGFSLVSGGAGVSLQYSTNGGKTWAACGGGFESSGGPCRLALSTVGRDAAASENRAAFLTNSATYIAVWDGAAWVSTSYAGKVFTGMSYANGYFIAGESNATDKTSLYYKLASDATTAAGWQQVVVDAVTQRSIYDVSFADGVYVAAGGNGSIYTATDLAGPWTQRTSNTTNTIWAVKKAGGRWVAVCGSGDVLTTLDPIAAWTKTGVGGTTRYRKDLHYLQSTGQWCISALTTSDIRYSTDGTTWAQRAPSLTTYAIAATAAGLLACNDSATYLIPNPAKNFYYTLSTSGDGGDARLVRASTGAELLRLAGGKVGSGNGGEGGSSTLIEVRTTIGAGSGMRGFGGNATGLAGTGTGGLIVLNPGNTPSAILGGGGALLLEDLLLNDGMAGIKIPGGSGALWLTGYQSGGGGSIMAMAGSGPASGIGPGGGMGSTSAHAGGGGEGIVRFAIAVTPGEVIAYVNGLAQYASSASYNPQHGFGMFEWE